MTFVIPNTLEARLRELANERGCEPDKLIEAALQRYLDDASITDLSPGDVAETQLKLLAELPGLEPWDGTREQ